MGADIFEQHESYLQKLKQADEQQRAMIEAAERASEIIRQQQEEMKSKQGDLKPLEPLPVANIVSIKPLINIKLDSGAEYFMSPDQFTQFLVSKKIPDSVEAVSKVIRGFKQEWKDKDFEGIKINCEIF